MARLKSRDALKDDLITIGESIMAVDGLPALQARTVADRAGCSVGTIYNVFDNIDGLILAVNLRTLAKLGSKLQDAVRRQLDADAEQRLTLLAFGYLDFAAAETPRWKAVFEHNMSDRHTVPEWYRTAQAPLFGILAQALPPGVPEGEKETAARMLFAAAHGIVALALDEKLSEGFDRAATERQLAMLVRMAGKGLAG